MADGFGDENRTTLSGPFSVPPEPRNNCTLSARKRFERDESSHFNCLIGTEVYPTLPPPTLTPHLHIVPPVCQSDFGCPISCAINCREKKKKQKQNNQKFLQFWGVNYRFLGELFFSCSEVGMQHTAFGCCWLLAWWWEDVVRNKAMDVLFGTQNKRHKIFTIFYNARETWIANRKKAVNRLVVE